jgi:pilus assembly protein CpaB
MRALVLGLILLALIAAGGTAYIAREMLSRQSSQPTTAEAPAEGQATMVLVADQMLPAGAVLSRSSFRWAPWPKQDIEREYVVSAPDGSNRGDLEQQFIETVARHAIPSGQPLTSALVFRRDAPGFLSGALAPGKRAMAVPVSAVTGAAGFVLPGDHVDVMLTHDIRRDFNRSNEGDTPVIADSVIRFTSETILRRLRVLAVDQAMADNDQQAIVGRTVTLEVTPKQAETLNVAQAMGDLSISLRSLAVDEGMDEDQSFTTDLQISPALAYLFQSMTRAMADARVASAQPQVSAASAKSVAPTARVTGARVKIYRGGRTSTQEFSRR